MHANGGMEESIIASINVTPLVDVALVLVMIFMITLPYLMEKGLGVRASQEKVVPVSSINEPILVEIAAEGVRLEGKMVPVSGLAAELRQVIDRRKIESVAVSADRRVSHGQVLRVLDEVMEGGAQQLDLLEPEAAGS